MPAHHPGLCGADELCVTCGEVAPCLRFANHDGLCEPLCAHRVDAAGTIQEAYG